MTLWLAYVPSGMEAAMVEDCEAIGITAVSPRKVEAVRTGNNRWPVLGCVTVRCLPRRLPAMQPR